MYRCMNMAFHGTGLTKTGSRVDLVCRPDLADPWCKAVVPEEVRPRVASSKAPGDPHCTGEPFCPCCDHRLPLSSAVASCSWGSYVGNIWCSFRVSQRHRPPSPTPQKKLLLAQVPGFWEKRELKGPPISFFTRHAIPTPAPHFLF